MEASTNFGGKPVYFRWPTTDSSLMGHRLLDGFRPDALRVARQIRNPLAFSAAVVVC